MLIISISLTIYAFFMPPTVSAEHRNGVVDVVVLLDREQDDESIDSSTVDSLLRQTYPPREISVEVDDVEEELGDSRVTAHRRNTLMMREMDADVFFVVARNGRRYDDKFIERSVGTFERSRNQSNMNKNIRRNYESTTL